VVRNSSYGLLAEGGTIDISDSLLSGNGNAVQSQASSTIRIANSDIYNNLAGFGCGAGTLASAGNKSQGRQCRQWRPGVCPQQHDRRAMTIAVLMRAGDHFNGYGVAQGG
jgi:hypothetical protein